VNQIQVNSKTGLTFANGLRSILRQDPNIIMVGEIRDEETASIAVNAALTGHLLLSTLHTNDASTTLPRLIDMKIEPFLIASTVNIALGQRLVRRICEHCKKHRDLNDNEINNLSALMSPKKLQDLKTRGIFYGKGCKECNNSGYTGRIGIHEVLEITDAVRDAILKRFSAAQIKEIAIKEGMTTMFDDGIQKVIDGITTIEEVLRVMHE
jgi:type IV pilus assembly protein PilB